jgi:signal transduction histidine kinase
MNIQKSVKKPISWTLERIALLAITVIFVGVIISGWTYAMKLRQTVAANNATTSVDPAALIEVERIRNLAEAQIADSRSFFLLGSKFLFDKQKAEKQSLTDSLVAFQKQYNLPQIPELIKHLDGLVQQHQEFFDQAMEFRAKQTESKIVGQFYQSKTVPILAQLNSDLDAIVKIQKAELDRSRTHAREAALNAEVQIPQGMTWFTGLITALFLCMALLVIRMLRGRTLQLAERDRLFHETKKAIEARDELMDAVSQDLKAPLEAINELANALSKTTDPTEMADGVQLIKSSVGGVEDQIKDICDQTKSDMGSLVLRLDQLGVSEVLDDARVILEPLAKQRNIRLQFESVNPPVLAFFDRERVIRVISNLVGNAIKFSPKQSKIVIKVRSDQQFVNISIADSGPGIAASQLATIFDNFWQARKTAAQGPGVGLAIVKTTIEAHGGTVKVDSHPGHGSTFTFSLPRRRPVGAQLRRPMPTVRTITAAPPIASPTVNPGVSPGANPAEAPAANTVAPLASVAAPVASAVVVPPRIVPKRVPPPSLNPDDPSAP